MSKRKVSVLLWVAAAVLTVFLAFYQRVTGPTYPMRGKETFDGKKVEYKFLRSFTEFKELPVKLETADQDLTGMLYYKRLKTTDEWTSVEMRRESNALVAELPGQPAAGKLEYKIQLSANGKTFMLNKGKPVIARFKGDVPAVFIITHVLFMFLSILFGIRTGMEVLRKEGNFSWMVNWTLGITFIGGMILGPIVQQYAFGDLWTGFPFGIDLTDNKLLIAVILWLVAFFLKKNSKWWVLVASVVMILVYLIPHSLLGSELDYESGRMRNKYTVITSENLTYKCVTGQMIS